VLDFQVLLTKCSRAQS